MVLQNLRFVFVDLEESVINALRNEVKKYVHTHSHIISSISFENGPIEEITKRYNRYIMVSPANSFGSMGGGIDYYINTFVFPNIQKEVQNVIRKRNNHFTESVLFDGFDTLGMPYVPVGDGFIIPVSFTKNHLAVIPTMEYPRIVKNTKNAYIAMKALMHCLKTYGTRKHAIETVLIPGFCCLTGEMDVNVMAEQMIGAFMEEIMN